MPLTMVTILGVIGVGNQIKILVLHHIRVTASKSLRWGGESLKDLVLRPVPTRGGAVEGLRGAVSCTSTGGQNYYFRNF